MRFTYSASNTVGRASLVAEREPGDRSLPVCELSFDLAPNNATNDQIAVASALAFGSCVATQYNFPDTISPEVVDGIQRATQLPVRAPWAERNTDDTPVRVTSLVVAMGTALHSHTPDVDSTRLTLVPGERFSGSLTGVKELVVASNAWLLGQYVGMQRVMAAAAVLFADDLMVRTIQVEERDAASTKETALITSLCSTLHLQT